MLCQKCNKHQATINWVGEGGTLEFVHGFYQQWCECCAVKAQIEYVEKQLSEYEELKAKKASLLQKEKDLQCI